MNKNTFINRVTWYNFILCILLCDSCTEYGSVFTEVVMIEGKPLFNQRLEQTIVSISQWSVWQDFFLCSDTCFTEIIPGGKCWKNTRRAFRGC